MVDIIDNKYFSLIHNMPERHGKSDIAVKCDICGDGHTGRKKRLHLFTKSNWDYSAINCFNCNWSGNMYTYLKEYHPEYYAQYKNEKMKESFSTLGGFGNDEPDEESKYDNIKIDTSLDFGAPVKSNELTPPVPTPNLVDPIRENVTRLSPEARLYLKNRGVEPKDNWLEATGKIMWNGNEIPLNEFIIIPLTWSDGRWYGLQALAYKKKQFYVLLVDGNENWKVWNWDKIDKTQPVYVCESIYDALSTGKENVIAQLGASLSNDRLQELNKVVFCLDNQYIDVASKDSSLMYAEQGHEVFVWSSGAQNFKDFNDLRKREVPFDIISKMIDNGVLSGMQAILKLKLIN